jgi:hypothetical protein
MMYIYNLLMMGNSFWRDSFQSLTQSGILEGQYVLEKNAASGNLLDCMSILIVCLIGDEYLKTPTGISEDEEALECNVHLGLLLCLLTQ